MSDMTVRTGGGLVRGGSADGVISFKGIPYAAPPEGPLRLRPPAPPASWAGVRDATEFGPAAPQPAPAPGVPPFWRPEDGLDCLTLNVWTLDLGAAGLPVMVWIHGGRWMIGSSSMPQYDAATLARSGVVVVTVNYRMGFEGFGHVPGVPGNRGLLDQIAALEWVHREIAGFGGDPGNVTLFGHSAGAASAALLLAAPATEGLFHRMIAQSVPDGYVDLADARQISRKLAAVTGVDATWDGFASVPPGELLVDESLLTVPGRPPGVYAPVILDGDLVTGTPWASIAARPRPSVDVICGFTHEEFVVFGVGRDQPGLDVAAVARSVGLDGDAAYRSTYPDLDDYELFIALMSDALIRMPTTWIAEAHAESGGRTWLYDFAWRGPDGAAHGVDVPFTFGNPHGRFAARMIGSPPPGDFDGLSERVRASWTAFAATGDPGWPAFDLTDRRTRIWDTIPADGPYPIPGSLPIWAAKR